MCIRMFPLTVCESVAITTSLKRSSQPSEEVRHPSLSVLKGLSLRLDPFQEIGIADWHV